MGFFGLFFCPGLLTTGITYGGAGFRLSLPGRNSTDGVVSMWLKLAPLYYCITCVLPGTLPLCMPVLSTFAKVQHLAQLALLRLAHAACAEQVISFSFVTIQQFHVAEHICVEPSFELYHIGAAHQAQLAAFILLLDAVFKLAQCITGSPAPHAPRASAASLAWIRCAQNGPVA